jgi:hypothetical protein
LLNVYGIGSMVTAPLPIPVHANAYGHCFPASSYAQPVSGQHARKKFLGNAKSMRKQQVGWEATVPPVYRTEPLNSTKCKSDNRDCQTMAEQELPAEEQGTVDTEQTRESGWRPETAVRSSLLTCLRVPLAHPLKLTARVWGGRSG